MIKQLDAFKHYLEDFAAKHQTDIKKNPEFRQHFQTLCAKIGVDPLACKFIYVVFFVAKRIILIGAIMEGSIPD